MFLKGREKAYGEVFKENFQNRKDQKENYDIVYCCHRIDVNRNNIGAITLFYTTRQYNAALENYGFSQGDIGKAMISFADMRSATRAGIGEDDTELIEASVKEHDAQAEECSKNMKLIKECLSSKE